MFSSNWFREIVSGRKRGWCPHALRGTLAAAEPVYRAVIRSKNCRYDTGRAQPHGISAPVISVGNLTVGGTGKTPLVCWLAQWFLKQGAAVTLISRGYGAKQGRPNDEALELAARLPGVPHLQNPDRVAAAKEALAANPRQVLILDDAFQHRRIARNLDIVLLDALEPFGYEHLLPRGLLREPVESLARAHVVALSRADAASDERRDSIHQRVNRIAPQAIWLELAHRPAALVNSAGERNELESLSEGQIAAFCGIGNPAGFRHTLSSCGWNLAGLRELADHFAYPPTELNRIEDWIKSLGPLAAVLCTRKDLVKIPRQDLAGVPLWAVEVQLEIVAGLDRLESVLAPLLQKVVPP